MRVGAIVLGAGAGTRFGGGKLLAPLAGRPVLQHVLDALATVGPAETVVVLAPAAASAFERAIEWRRARRVLNGRPEEGLASSLRVGLAALAESERPVDAALICLGDQPRLRPAVVRALLAALAADPSRPIVVPAYAADGGRNPVLLGRAAWDLADDARGDRGLGPLLEARPELVTSVPVDGDNPDVDTPEDLARLEPG